MLSLNQINYNKINYNKMVKPMIIHLIGFNKPVSKAADEIQMFAEEIYTKSTIISNNKISILNEYLTTSIIINKCNLINCHEIKLLHQFINVSSLYSYNSFAFLVNTNSKHKIELKLHKCMDITDIYNINDSKFHKRNTIIKYFN